MLEAEKVYEEVFVENRPDLRLVRDRRTNAVCSTDRVGYDRAVQMKAKRMETEERMNTFEQELSDVKGMVANILDILTEGGNVSKN